MFQSTATNKDGVEKRVFATEESDMKDAEKAVKAQSAPVYPNINVPVKKGHDLVNVSEDMSTTLVDGTGAHNSPYDALDSTGKESGDKDVKFAGLEEKPYKKAGSAEPVDAPKLSKSPAAKQPLQEDGTNRASNVSSNSSTSLDQGAKENSKSSTSSSDSSSSTTHNTESPSNSESAEQASSSNAATSEA